MVIFYAPCINFLTDLVTYLHAYGIWFTSTVPHGNVPCTANQSTLYCANFTLMNGKNMVTENYEYKLKYIYFKYIYSFPVHRSHNLIQTHSHGSVRQALSTVMTNGAQHQWSSEWWLEVK